MRLLTFLILPSVTCALRGGKGMVRVNNDGMTEDATATRNIIDHIPCPGPFFSRSSPEIVECSDEKNKKQFVLESVQGFYCCTLLHKLQDWQLVDPPIAGEDDDDRLGLGIQNGAGVSMSASGNRVAVSSRQNTNEGGKVAGVVRVYEDTPFGWEMIGQPIRGHGDGEHFGWSLAMSHNGKVVAASSVRNHGSRGTYQGVVRVYMFDEESFPPMWRQFGAELHGDDVLDYFGHSVSVCSEGNVVAIGAIQHFGIEGKRYTGYVKIFGWNGSRWHQMGSTLYGTQNGDKFGHAVGLSANGKVVAIGAAGETGSATMFRYMDGAWMELGQTLVGLDDQEHFGYALAISVNGKTVAVGAPRAGQLSSGSVRVYHLRNDEWFQVGEDIMGLSEDAEFGSTVSMSADGGTIAIGSPHAHGDKEVFEGQVRTFTFRNERWELLGEPILGTNASENFGYSVSLSKDAKRLAATAPYTDVEGRKHTGELRIYGIQ